MVFKILSSEIKVKNLVVPGVIKFLKYLNFLEKSFNKNLKWFLKSFLV